MDGSPAMSRMSLEMQSRERGRPRSRDTSRQTARATTIGRPACRSMCARELGYRIRLVAVAARTGDDAAPGPLALRVSPALVRLGTPLAETRGAYNAVSLVGDAVGRMFFHGLGAGQMPTASAVVADIIDTVVGRAAITFRTTGVLDVDSPAARIGGVETHERRFLRIPVVDRPGVLAEIAGILGQHGISIASFIQHEAAGNGDAAGAAVPLIIMTHHCGSNAMAQALAAIERSATVRGTGVCLPVLDDGQPASAASPRG